MGYDNGIKRFKALSVLQKHIFQPYCGPAFHAFEEMGLAESLVSGINLWGLSVPYALEKIAIPAFLSGIDMIVEGPPCTGKTTSASIGALNKLNTNLKKLQAIFLVPADDVAELVRKRKSIHFSS